MLESHRQKRYFRQIIVYFFLLIITVGFIVTVGIKILINLTLFVANITHPKTNNSHVKKQKTEFILPPEIFQIPTATNSSQIKISGRGSKGKNLYLYVNNQLEREVLLQDDIFETEVDLTSPENRIYLVLEDPQTKQKKQSDVYTVIYKSKKPKLEIISPQDQEKTSKDEIEVVGQTEKEVLVKINDFPVVVDAEGRFSSTVRLTEGENKIIIEAEDIAGNLETKKLTVVYQKED